MVSRQKKAPEGSSRTPKGLWKENYGKIWGRPIIQNNNNHNSSKMSNLTNPQARQPEPKRNDPDSLPVA
jgi:hypothetical protein